MASEVGWEPHFYDWPGLHVAYLRSVSLIGALAIWVIFSSLIKDMPFLPL